MRRAAVSGIAVLAFAVLASGCGSPDPTALLDTGDGATATTPATTTPGSTVSTGDQPTVNEISNADAKPGDKVKISAVTPPKFVKAACDKSILVVLYQPGADLDEALVAQARLAARGRKNLVTMMYTPSQVKEFGDLPSKLGLLTTPGLAIVNRAGRIETFWTNFVDYQLIGYQLDRAAAAKPCKIGEEDVPAAGSAFSDAAIVASGGTVKDTTTTPLAGTPPGTPAIDAAAAPVT